MNILFSINGLLPNMTFGGGAKVTGLLLDQLKKLQDPDITPFLLAHHGVVSGEELMKIHHIHKSSDKTQLALKRIWGNLDQPLAFFSYMLKNRFLIEKFGDVDRLNTILQFSKKRTQKHWQKWIRKGETCVVHNNFNTGSFPILESRDPNKHKVITSYHSKGSLTADYASDWEIKGTPLEEEINRQESYEIRNSDIITFPSRGAYNLMKSAHPEAFLNKEVHVIHNGIDIDKISTLLNREPDTSFQRKKGFTLINVGAHVWQKRFDLLLQALSFLKDKIDFELINIGEGALLQENINLAKKLGIESKVKFVGRKRNEEVINLLSQSDAFVMPSENVIFDIITLEAMAVGIPIIVSEDGGNLECIRNGVDGILTKVGDPKSVANAIQQIYENPKHANEMANSAKIRAKNEFSNERMLNNYLSLYRGIYPKTL